MAITGSLPSIRRQVPNSPSFERAFAYLAEVLTPGTEASRRILALRPGESGRVELGGGVHAMEQSYRTRRPEEGRFESHRAHLDVQAVVVGRERIAVAEAGRLTMDEDLTPGKDVIFYRPTTEASELSLSAGDAAILFPSDAHLPGLELGRPAVVHKTVVKVPV
jgi:YhcH/YjgK/YiaL family protein